MAIDGNGISEEVMSNPKTQIPNLKSQALGLGFRWDLGFGHWALGFSSAPIPGALQVQDRCRGRSRAR